jgi:hypothetical protein
VDTNGLRQLFLGQSRKDPSSSQLPAGDNVRHGSASDHLPLEGKLAFRGAHQRDAP